MLPVLSEQEVSEPEELSAPEGPVLSEQEVSEPEKLSEPEGPVLPEQEVSEPGGAQHAGGARAVRARG